MKSNPVGEDQKDPESQAFRARIEELERSVERLTEENRTLRALLPELRTELERNARELSEYRRRFGMEPDGLLRRVVRRLLGTRDDAGG